MKKLLALLSLSTFTTLPVGSFINTTNSNRTNNNKLVLNEEHFINLKDVIKNTNLGEIFIGSDIKTINQKIGFITNKLAKLNSNLDISEIEIISPTETTAIVSAEKSLTKYVGEVQITYKFIESDEPDEDVTDISTLIDNNTNFGNMKIKELYRKVPNEKEIKDKIDYLFPLITIANLIVSDITKTDAVIYGDNEEYRGSVKVTFKTVLINEIDLEEMSNNLEPFKSYLNGDTDCNSFNFITDLFRTFMHTLGTNTVFAKASINFFGFKEQIYKYFNDYFRKKLSLEIQSFTFYEGPDSEEITIRDESRLRSKLIEDKEEVTINCTLKWKNNVKDSGDFINKYFEQLNFKFKNESVMNQNAFTERKSYWSDDNRRIDAKNLSGDDLFNYVNENKDKLIAKYVDSEFFKPFLSLYKKQRIKVDFFWEYKTHIYRSKRLVFEISFDYFSYKEYAYYVSELDFFEFY